MDRVQMPPWDVAGPAGGPRIVFVHGSRLARGSWQPVMRRLAASCRVAAPDLPGHGELGDLPFTMDRALDVVDGAVDAVGGPPVVLVGLSLGGYVATAYAAAHPDRVRGLVLAGATAEPTGPAASAFRLYAWVLAAAPQRALDTVNTWFFRRRYPAEVAEPIVAGGYWSSGGATAVRLLTSLRFRDLLLAYGGPILAINGEFDLVFRLGARSYLRDVPNVRRRTLKRTTHLSPMDRPDAFAAAVARFLEQLPG
jgi:pimeloyl-ACP methyl ester carboxylesterase